MSGMRNVWNMDYIWPERIEILFSNILWHVDPLLGNDREISKYKTAAAK
jgi:hypothetical protein